MRLRNGPAGYGLVTKLLHWLTVAAIATQFVVGWTMDDSASERAETRLERLEEQAERDGGAVEERMEAEIERREEALDAREDDIVPDAFSDVVSGDVLSGGVSAPEAHVLLGLLILTLAVVRVLWRRTTPLPPWAEHLGPRERTVEAWLEKVLLLLLFVVPLTGLLLVAGETDWLPVHVAAQIAFLAAVPMHVGLVLKHTVVQRDRHLARML